MGSMSARCFSSKSRFAERLKRGRCPSLERRISRTPVAESEDWVMSRGRWRLGSRLRIQDLRRVDFPVPGQPVRSMTLRSAAQVLSRVSASLWEGVGKRSDFSSGAKGMRTSPQARSSSSMEAPSFAVRLWLWCRSSACIVVALVVGLAVEVEIGQAGHALEGALMPDFDLLKACGVVAQFHLEGAQGEVDFKDPALQPHGAVFAHDPLGSGIKKRVDFIGLLHRAQRMACAGKTLMRAHPGGAMRAQMVVTCDPAREGGVERIEATHVIAFQTQGGLKITLDGANEPLDFALAPSVIGFGVQEPDAEIGAHQPGVGVDEGLALVGVEFMRKAASQHRLFKAVQEGGRVAGKIIGRIGNEPTMVIHDHAQLRAHRRAFRQTQGHPGCKIHHPQIIGCGRFKRLLWSVFKPPRPEASPVITVLFQKPIDRTYRGKLLALLAPMPVEHQKWNVRIFPHACEDRGSRFFINATAFASVLTHRFSSKPIKALLLVIIPPRFQCAAGVITAISPRPRARGSFPQALRQRVACGDERFDVADDLKAQKREAFLQFGCGVFHEPRVFAPRLRHPNKRFCGMPPTPQNSLTRGLPAAANLKSARLAAGCGNPSKARC